MALRPRPAPLRLRSGRWAVRVGPVGALRWGRTCGGLVPCAGAGAGAGAGGGTGRDAGCWPRPSRSSPPHAPAALPASVALACGCARMGRWAACVVAAASRATSSRAGGGRGSRTVCALRVAATRRCQAARVACVPTLPMGRLSSRRRGGGGRQATNNKGSGVVVLGAYARRRRRPAHAKPPTHAAPPARVADRRESGLVARQAGVVLGPRAAARLLAPAAASLLAPDSWLLRARRASCSRLAAAV